jgi:chromosome segregation ATPase
MTQPNNPAAAIAALQAAFSQAVERLTAVEQALEAARPRLTALEERAVGFDTRMRDMEGDLRELKEAAPGIVERQGQMAGELAQFQEAITRLGQVARPGRTVMRQKVDDLQATLAEILKRLPETPEGGTAR